MRTAPDPIEVGSDPSIGARPAPPLPAVPRLHIALTEIAADPPLASEERNPAKTSDTPADGSGTVKKTKLATILVTAACAATALTALATTTSAQTTRADGQAVRGGTYRVDWESSFDFSSGFDPTGEYSVQAFGLYSNLLVRTLVGYNHVAGPAGNQVVPDLATNLGAISRGGRTYTFTAQARASASARR